MSESSRAGRNEALFRKVNEEIENLGRSVAQLSDHALHLVCECTDLHCAETIVLPIHAYEDIRADPELFLVKPGHEVTSLETVIEERAGYFVVRKSEGEAGRVARETAETE